MEAPFHDRPPEDMPARQLDLWVKAKEAQTGRLMVGAGINSEAGLVGSVIIDEQNFDWTRPPTSWEDIRDATAFRGAGEHFRIEAVPGTQTQRYAVSFQEPYLGDSEVSMSLSGYYFQRIYIDQWDEQRVGGRVSFGYHLTRHLTGNVSFRGEDVRIYAPAVAPGAVPALDQVIGHNGLYGFGVGLAHDTRDNQFLATEGHLVQVSFEQVIGSYQYSRVDLDARQSFLLHERPDSTGRHTLSLITHAGITGNNTPIYDRYFAGGFSTIRGFQFRGVSPAVDVPDFGNFMVGGNFELLASLEYMFPITADDMLRGVVFCDTGTVQPTINNWTDKYRVAPGFGLRITIPAMGPAPIAFDFAFPVVSQSSDQKEVFSFFLGIMR
jgi:outer membrane protein insertion porin family